MPATESMSNVVVARFARDSDAYEALTKLKELDSQRQIELTAAAVVVRKEDGGIDVRDEVGNDGLQGTATGGLIGLLIGVLAGPLGILIGGATGVLVGSLFDLEDDEDATSILGGISSAVRVGETALLAEVVEQSPDVLDSAMAALSGTLLRRPVQDVEAELAAAEGAQREAKKKARKLLHEQHHTEHQEKVHAKVAELKSKLHPRKDTATAGG